jgi:REP element-mobilizing transposase RayT
MTRGDQTGTNVANSCDVMSRPKRLRNRSYVGKSQYFLTFCVRERRPVFEDADVASETLAHLLRACAVKSFALLAYCLMPDHAHLLVEGLTATSDLRRFVKSAKERSGRAYRIRADARLWQEGYFERVLRDDADARRYAKYIVTDPVRSGLVAKVTDYQFVGSTEWTLEELTKRDSRRTGCLEDHVPTHRA